MLLLVVLVPVLRLSLSDHDDNAINDASTLLVIRSKRCFPVVATLIVDSIMRMTSWCFDGNDDSGRSERCQSLTQFSNFKPTPAG